MFSLPDFCNHGFTVLQAKRWNVIDREYGICNLNIQLSHYQSSMAATGGTQECQCIIVNIVLNLNTHSWATIMIHSYVSNAEGGGGDARLITANLCYRNGHP